MLTYPRRKFDSQPNCNPACVPLLFLERNQHIKKDISPVCASSLHKDFFKEVINEYRAEKAKNYSCKTIVIDAPPMAEKHFSATVAPITPNKVQDKKRSMASSKYFVSSSECRE